MNKIEQAAQAAEGQLRPLSMADREVPVLACPAVVGAVAGTVTAVAAVYGMGNMVSDFVGQHADPNVNADALGGKSGQDLLNIRQHGVQG